MSHKKDARLIWVNYKGQGHSRIKRPNKKNKCLSGKWSEILGRVGIQFFFLNIILCILKGISPLKVFKMHKIIFFFSRKPEINLGFTSKFR